MKQVAVFYLLISITSICRTQLKDTLLPVTPAERSVYVNDIKKGRGQKALGLLIILGGTAMSTAGAGVAIIGIDGAVDDDTYYRDEDVSTRDRLLWQGGSLLFLIGVGTIGIGADMIKDGGRNVRSGKFNLKLSGSSLGVTYNF